MVLLSDIKSNLDFPLCLARFFYLKHLFNFLVQLAQSTFDFDIFEMLLPVDNAIIPRLKVVFQFRQKYGKCANICLGSIANEKYQNCFDCHFLLMHFWQFVIPKLESLNSEMCTAKKCRHYRQIFTIFLLCFGRRSRKNTGRNEDQLIFTCIQRALALRLTGNEIET